MSRGKTHIYLLAIVFFFLYSDQIFCDQQVKIQSDTTKFAKLDSTEVDSTKDYEIIYELNITDLRDDTTKALINVGDITNFILIYNDGIIGKSLGFIQATGLGKGYSTGYIKLPTLIDGNFLTFGWAYPNGFVFNATMTFYSNRTGILGARFIKWKEN